MRPRYEIKVFNAGLVLMLYILVSAYSCADAQAIQRICQTGYEVSYGLHNFKPQSAGEQVRKISPGSRGIAFGAFLGNNLLKIRFRGLGLYEANRVFDEKYFQYEAELLSNFYPLEFFRVTKNVMDIYLITGVNYTVINFDNNVSSYGKSRFDQLSRVGGMGIEYILRKSGKTIRVFSEATVGNKLSNLEASDAKTPFPSILSAINFGVRMEYKRQVKIKSGF